MGLLSVLYITLKNDLCRIKRDNIYNTIKGIFVKKYILIKFH